MKRLVAAFIFLLFYTGSVFATGQKLSPLAEAGIITCSPGQELYSVFGHSAIRISDPMNNIDQVYNYGTFDFDTPNFYLKFARGQLDYMLSVEPYKYFYETYVQENRSVWEQLLDLTPAEKQKLFDLLEENARPENKFYRYDYFYDNCSSRIRDILLKALNRKIIFPDMKGTTDSTFRELIEPYMPDFRWGDFGIDMALGLPTDRVATSDQHMFLPYKLKQAFAGAKHRDTEKPLVKTTQVLFKAKNSGIHNSEAITPNVLFWGLLVVVIAVSALLWWRNPVRYWFDFTFFLVFGLLGIFLLLLWLGTDHKAAAYNMNILWAMPLHAVMAFFLLKKNKPRFVNFYFLGYSLLMLLLLISYKALPQWLNFSTIPIIMTLCIRSFIIFWKENRD